MTVLVVDDSRTARVLHQRALEAAGYQVITAEDASDALSRLSLDASIGLVVTDLEMDQMDGVELTKAIRAARTELPIVIVTSSGRSSDQERARAAGADAYIVKQTFSWRVLLHTIKRLLGETGLEPTPTVA
jgi:two-component system, chemotaxis family, sensor kinase CheA